MPTVDPLDPANVVVLKRTDWMRLTEQRAALVRALNEVSTDQVFESLEGVLSLLEHMSDLAEENGLLSPVDRENWWIAGCEAVGMPVDLSVDCDHEKLTLKDRHPVCRRCGTAVA